MMLMHDVWRHLKFGEVFKTILPWSIMTPPLTLNRKNLIFLGFLAPFKLALPLELDCSWSSRCMQIHKNLYMDQFSYQLNSKFLQLIVHTEHLYKHFFHQILLRDYLQKLYFCHLTQRWLICRGKGWEEISVQ